MGRWLREWFDVKGWGRLLVCDELGGEREVRWD